MILLLRIIETSIEAFIVELFEESKNLLLTAVVVKLVAANVSSVITASSYTGISSRTAYLNSVSILSLLQTFAVLCYLEEFSLYPSSCSFRTIRRKFKVLFKTLSDTNRQDLHLFLLFNSFGTAPVEMVIMDRI